MQITDILAQMGGLQSMARELGVSENQAASGAEALIPAILGGFKKQTQSQPSGVEGLGDLLGQLGGGVSWMTCFRRSRRKSIAATMFSDRSSAPRT